MAFALAATVAEPALAQARNPFGVGISEGGGGTTGVTGWLLAQQAWFEHAMSLAVRGSQTSSAALWTLVGISFLYGVFHAAGPGHGKAVLASYMVANERALTRGMALSTLAALLQGAVAVALVGAAVLIFHATAASMKLAASWIEFASFAGIAALGLWLTWRKGVALKRLLDRPRIRRFGDDTLGGLFGAPRASQLVFATAAVPQADSRFICVDADTDVAHPDNCPHCIGPEAAIVSGPGFSIRDAALTVGAAGMRPCSGAILVLVFALVQGVFSVGVLAVLAMSVGVAITTTALASIAVLAKGVAQRLARPGTRRAALCMAGLEFLAATLVLLAGLGLLTGTTMAGA